MSGVSKSNFARVEEGPAGDKSAPMPSIRMMTHRLL